MLIFQNIHEEGFCLFHFEEMNFFMSCKVVGELGNQQSSSSLCDELNISFFEGEETQTEQHLIDMFLSKGDRSLFTSYDYHFSNAADAKNIHNKHTCELWTYIF